MKNLNRAHGALSFCAAVMSLQGCGGLQPPTVNSASASRSAVHNMSASSYNVLYRFHSGTDGAYPHASLIKVKGALYGTTSGGGTKNCKYRLGKYCGTVFSVTTAGKESVLYRFAGGIDGGNPFGSLTDVKGTLYGTTLDGGANGYGTIFSLTTTGAEKVVYSFNGGSDGAYPTYSVINVNGTLYGTTTEGGGSGCGGYGCGTIFSVTATGTEKILYRFTGASDGRDPNGGLINVKGTLYGTTYLGPGSGCFGFGCGTVFSITTSGTEKTLHRFGRGSDGQNPEAGLTNVDGTLFGTTTFGGGTDYDGTVFSITRSGREKVLHKFKFGSSDGDGPGSSLTNVNGTLYGTTIEGGSKTNSGTVYSITTAGYEQVVYSFGGGSDGALPYDSVVDMNGTLYGTTYVGGSNRCRHHLGCGIVFALTP